MSTSPQDSSLLARLHTLESALAGDADPGDCLRLLREIMAGKEIPAEDRRETLPVAGPILDSERARALGAAAIQALPTQIAVLDGAGNIVSVNETWRRFALDNGGESIPGLGVGNNYLEVCRRACGERSDEAQAAARGIRAVLEGRQTLFTLEYPCHAPNKRRWFLMQVTPLAQGPRGALIIHLDITGRKLAEDLARRQQAQLAQVARLHTIGALASALAHEISQPLAAIGIYSNAAAHLLERGGTIPGDLAEVMRQIEAQVKRAGDIVARVREVTRWRTAEKAPIDLCETVAEAVRMTRPLATEHQVALGLELPEDPIRVQADRAQIAQVVVNLLCNGIEAIDLAESPERRVRVRVAREAQGARVTVQDSGPGIRTGWQERIFDIFETDKATATGMGLTISRSLVEGHGGRLWADPQGECGAVFHFTLPGTPDGQVDRE